MKRVTKISLAVYLIMLCTIFTISMLRYYSNSKEIIEIENQNSRLYYNDMANTIKNPDNSVMSPLIIDSRAYLPAESIARITGLGIKVDNDNNSLMLSSEKNIFSPASSAIRKK